MDYKVKVSNITCSLCAKTIEKHFATLNVDVIVNPVSKIVTIKNTSHDLEYICKELVRIGYYPLISNDKNYKRNKLINRIELIVGIILAIPISLTMLIHMNLGYLLPPLLHDGYFIFILTTILIIVCSRRFFVPFINSAKRFVLGMDSLIIIGSLSAYFYSAYLTFFTDSHMFYYEATALILVLQIIGNTIENRIKENSTQSLSQLALLTIDECWVEDGNNRLKKSIKDIKKGDVIIVLPGEKIPLDGFIMQGETYVNTASITGEAMPREYNTNDYVYAQYENLTATIMIKVDKTVEETVFSSIINTIEETQNIKIPMQRLADKIARVFVPIILVVSLATFLVYYFILNRDLDFALKTAITVLVISCPCAFGLATPMSIGISAAFAFKNAILYKGPEFFEVLPKLDIICFDKTATLTKGDTKVVAFLGDIDTIKYTYYLEKNSNHPLSKAILDYVDDQKIELPTLAYKDFETKVSFGISFKIDNEIYYCGSQKYLDQFSLDNQFLSEKNRYEQEGYTIIYTFTKTKVLNMIIIGDEIKGDAKLVIDKIKKLGIKVAMITGDNQASADHVARLLDIDYVYANTLPTDKADIIKNLQEGNKKVAFVGDGINDSVALTLSDCAIAVNNASVIASTSSDITLLNNQLITIYNAIILSKKTLNNIIENFIWAFGYNLLAIPLSIFGLLDPVVGAIGMSVSSLMVVVNAQRIRLLKIGKEN